MGVFGRQHRVVKFRIVTGLIARQGFVSSVTEGDAWSVSVSMRGAREAREARTLGSLLGLAAPAHMDHVIAQLHGICPPRRKQCAVFFVEGAMASITERKLVALTTSAHEHRLLPCQTYAMWFRRRLTYLSRQLEGFLAAPSD